MKKLVPAIMINNLNMASRVFEGIMQGKITDAIEAKKFELAQSIGEKKKLDAVDHDELDGDHDDREDKDIDNDGDVDSSDEYLHNRRKTIKKKIKNEEIDVDEGVTTTLKFKKDADGVSAGGKKVGNGNYKFTFKNDTEMMQFMDKNSSKMLEGVETEIAREKESIARSNEKIKSLQDKENRKKAIGDKK
jgi:hypothetical protein